VHPLHGLLGFQPVADQVRDAADLQAVLLREDLQFGATRHRAILVQDLDQHRRRLQPGQRGEVATGLGVAGAGEHAARLRGEREDVAGLGEILRLRIALHRHLDGARAVVRRDAGGDALGRLDRDGEVRVVRRGVVADHGPQAELARALLGEREAQQAARLAHHEVHVLRPHHLRGHHDVAFVLAVLVVEDHDHAAGADVVEDFGDGVETHE
jgi:hypothetical protein